MVSTWKRTTVREVLMVKIVRSKGDGEEGGGGVAIGREHLAVVTEREVQCSPCGKALAFHNHHGGGLEQPRGIQEGEGRVE